MLSEGWLFWSAVRWPSPWEPVGADLERGQERQAHGDPSRLKTASLALSVLRVALFTRMHGNAGNGGSTRSASRWLNRSHECSVVFGVGDAMLNDGNPQSLVMFMFSEAVLFWSLTLAVAHGACRRRSGAWNSTSATATFTRRSSSAGTGRFSGGRRSPTRSVALARWSYTVRIDMVNLGATSVVLLYGDATPQ